MQLKKRNHDELSIPEFAMRYDEIIFPDRLIAEQLYIDIERPGALGDLGLPVPPEFRLDSLNDTQKLAAVAGIIPGNRHIEKVRLVNVIPGTGNIERRDANIPQNLREPPDGSRKNFAGVSAVRAQSQNDEPILYQKSPPSGPMP